MGTAYKATERIEGESLGLFTPIRFSDGSIAYQSVCPKTGDLLGILWSDGQYRDAFRNGKKSWEICEETAAHRRILARASSPWDVYGITFTPVAS